jgi:hypothetical protein
MLSCLIEAARIIEDGGPYGVVPQYFESGYESPPWGWAPPGAMHRDSFEPDDESDESDAPESSDDLVVPAGRSETPEPEPEQKPYRRCPETHNEVEKRRRAFLTRCYTKLQEELPSIADIKASNVTVLNEASEYITALRREEKRLLSEKRKALNRRAALMAKLEAAKEEVSVGADESCSADDEDMAMPMRTPSPQHQAGIDGETDEEGVVPDTMSRHASPSPAPVEDLTKLSAMTNMETKKKRRRALDGKSTARTSRSPVGKSANTIQGRRRTSRPLRKKIWA